MEHARDRGGLPALNARLASDPMVGFHRWTKRAEDLVLAILILFLIGPLLAVLAIGVKLSGPGPVIFRQRRHGWDGRPIEVYKLRTMVPHREPGDRVTPARRGDPRVTRFGAFLRRTSLDELPQFVNVLQGRMSIVGPRPHALAHSRECQRLVESYMLRHRVKPGITGWAQVNGWRGPTDTPEKIRRRVEHDLDYIENWSLAFDLEIIALTVIKGFRHPNAF